MKLTPYRRALFPLALALAVLGSAGAQAPLKLGVITSLTGPYADSAQVHLAGMRQAVADLNAKGGVNGRPLELLIEDDGNSASRAQTAAEKLVQAKVPLVITASSAGVTRPVSQTMNRLKVPLITSAATEEIITRPGNAYTFRVNSPSGVTVHSLLDQLGRLGGLATAVVLTSNDNAGLTTSADLAALLPAKGITLLSADTYEDGTSDFSDYFQKYRTLKPDVVFLIPRDQDAASMVKQLRTVPVAARVTAGLGETFTTAAFLRAAGPAAENLVIPLDWNADVKYPGAALLYAKLKLALGGAEPGQQAAQSYAAVMVAADALRRGGVNPERLTEALQKTKLTTPFGPVAFRTYADYTNQNSVIGLVTQVQSGKKMTVAPASVARSKIIIPKR